MASATRVFVYEYLSAGGAGDSTSRPLDDLLAAGTAMRDALVDDFAALGSVVVSRAVHAGEMAARRSPRVIDIAPPDSESATEFVSRNARAHDLVLVVAPETDGILAALHDAVGAPRWLGCTSEAIAVASSKTATRRCLAAHRIATTTSGDAVGRIEPNGAGWVVKPDDGAGCVDTRWFERFDDARVHLEQRLQRGEAATMEAWIDGEPLSLSLICRNGNADLASINRQHVEIDQDRAVRYEGVDISVIDPRSARATPLADIARRVAHAVPGLRGFVGIDIVDDPRRGPVVIEVNPRVTCAYVGLSAASGRNLAREMLEAHRSSCVNHAAA